MNIPFRSISGVLRLALYFLVVVTYLLNAGRELQNHVNLAETDTTSYLEIGQTLKLAGGIPGFWRDCLNGTYRETNQHPAYPLLLQFTAEADPAFFVRAKVISLLFGLLTVLSMLWIGHRVAGAPVAILGGTLLAMNVSFANLTSMVACEAMLALAFLWTVYFLTRPTRTRAIDIATGLACGVAYMTKGTGIFLIPVIVVTLAFAHRARAMRSIAWLLLGFVVAAFPLLARNTIVHKNPVYNINTHVMWVDEWESVFSLAFMTSRGRSFSATSYFREHTSEEVRARVATGIDYQFRLLRRMFSEPVLWRVERVYLPLLLLGFGTGVVVSWRRWGLPALLLGVGFWAFFTWYSVITTHARFWMPVLPILFTTAAWGFWWAARKVSRLVKREELVKREKLADALFLTATALVALLGVRTAWLEKGDWNWEQSYEMSSGYAELRSWMNESFEGERILAGPSHSYPMFYTMDVPPKNLVYPNVTEASALEELLIERGISFAICDREIFERRKASLSQLFAWPEGASLTVREEAKPRWHVVLIDPHVPPGYAILSFHPTGEGEANDER